VKASEPRPGREADSLAGIAPVPAERDLPAGRRHILKEHLMTEFRADQPAAQLPRARVSRRLTLTAAIGGVAAAAVVTASLTGLGGAASPNGRQPQGGAHLTAAQLLGKAADAAAHAPAPHVRDNQFSYVSSEDAFGTDDGPAPAHPHKRQVWLSVSDLCVPGLLIENGQRTPLDDATANVEVERHGKLVPSHVPCPQRGGLNDPTYRSLQSLPTDPRALLHLIYTEERGAGQSPGQEAFTTIGDLLRESIPPPAISAALYKAAAMIPGVTIVPDAVDAIGRHGVAVSFTFRGVQEEWIFNKNTFQWIGERDFVHGKLVGKDALLQRAIVDHAGELPASG
jgi:hypothetical protein